MHHYLTIAHVSDLHFGRHETTAATALQQSLFHAKPDFLVASGDLSDHGWKGEVSKALQFLSDISRSTGRPCPLIIVPGNHDLGITRFRRGWTRAFAEATSLAPPNQVLSQHYLHGDNEGAVCDYYPEHGLVFLKFDSNMVGNWPWDIARGRVGNAQLLQMRALLNDCSTSLGSGFTRSRRIAVVHHHIQYLPDTEADGLLLMKDAGDFWRAMLDMKVELILHGHKHYAAQMVLRNYQHGEFKELAILAAGAATARSRPKDQPCSYYLIKCSPFQFSVTRCELSGIDFRDAGFPPVEFSYQPKFIVPRAEGAEPIDVRALALIMSAEGNEMDSSHSYSMIRIGAKIDRNFNYTACYQFTGTNNSDQPSQGLTIPIVVVGAPKLNAGDFVATDLLTNTALPHVDVTLTKINKISLTLFFETALAPEKPFSVELRFRLPGVMYPTHDYDAFNVSRFVNGVARLEYLLESEFAIVGPRIFSVHADGLSEDQGSLERVEGLSTAWRKTLDNPTAIGILVYYERLDISANGK